MASSPGAPIRDGEIRILTIHSGRYDDEPIHCTLENRNITQAVMEGYSALSYTWGPPDQRKVVIKVDGRDAAVGVYLHDALVELRHRTIARRYWIDALCIRQDDPGDKTRQLSLMGPIYSLARTVEIWLGKDAADGEWAMETMRMRNLAAVEQDRFGAALTAILKRPWFTRLWIVQEVALAPLNGLSVRIGGVEVSWESLHHTVDFFNKNVRQPLQRALVAVIDLPALLAIAAAEVAGTGTAEERSNRTQLLDKIRRGMRETATSSEPAFLEGYAGMSALGFVTSLRDLVKAGEGELSRKQALSYLTFHTRYHHTTDPRDKIYALLGMVDEPTRVALSPNYRKTTPEVFCDATVYLLKDTPFRFSLYYSFPLGYPAAGPDGGFPTSWQLDFSPSSEIGFSELFVPPWPKQHNAGNISKPNVWFPSPGVMGTSAIIIDVVAHLFTLPIHTTTTVVRDMFPDGFTTTGVGKLDEVSALAEISALHAEAAALASKWAAPGGLEPLCETLVMSQFWMDSGKLTGAELQKELEAIMKSVARSKQMAALIDIHTAAEAAAGRPAPDLEMLKGLEHMMYSSSREAGEVLLSPPGDPTGRPMHLSTFLRKLLFGISTKSQKTFFVTSQGLCGLCTGKPQVGDTVAVLFGASRSDPKGKGKEAKDMPPSVAEVPFVLRRAPNSSDVGGEERYSMVGVAKLSGDWVKYCQSAGKTEVANIEIV